MGERPDNGDLSGGCQCGAVRFVCDALPGNVHICHCRMCQKAVGGPFAVLCPVRKADFHITRGAIAWFQSSGLARRGFCRDCGTPMIFDYPSEAEMGVLSGCFDDPALVPPVIQYGNESRVPWLQTFDDIPGKSATYTVDPKGFLPRIAASNRQHPDHDTDHWTTHR